LLSRLRPGSLFAIPLSGSGSPTTLATCLNPKSVTNLKTFTSTVTLTSCTDLPATGGRGTAVVNFKVLTKELGTITWNKTGTTTFTLTKAVVVKVSKCPKGTVQYDTSGTVTGGTGAALNGIPKGSPYSESACANTKTGATTMRPGTKVIISARAFLPPSWMAVSPPRLMARAA
jgi:hypothetical protein